MAVRHTRKTKHSKKHSTKKHSTSTKHASHSGESMKIYCVGCRAKTMVHNLKEETYKVNGNTRRRMVGKCEKDHKVFRIMKSE